MKIKQDGGPILTPNNLPGRTPVQIMITGSDCEVEATKKPRKQRKDPLKESRRQEKNLVNAATTGARPQPSPLYSALMADREDPESLNKLPSSTSTRPRQLALPTNKKNAVEHPATTSQPWVVSLDTLGGIRETVYL